MDVRLPNGVVVKNVPEGTQKSVVQQRAIKAGLASEADFESLVSSSPTGELPFRPFGIDTGLNMPEGVSEFMAGAGKEMTDLGRGIGQLFNLVDDEDVAAARARDAALMESTPAKAGGVAALIGSILAGGTLLRGAGYAGNALGASRTGGALDWLGTSLFNPQSFKQAAVGGGLAGASQPTVGDESRLLNTTLGAGGGTAGYGIASTVGRALRPTRSPLSPEDAALADYLEKQGVQLDALDLTKSEPLKRIEKALERIPFTASKAAARADKRAEQFTRAALRSTGAEADQITPEVLDEIAGRLGGQFDEMVRGNPLSVDDAFFGDLKAIIRDSENLPKSLAPKGVKKILAELSEMEKYLQSGQKPAISPESYQLMTSALAKRARASKAANPQQAEVYGRIREVLDDLAERNMGGEKLGAWKDLRRRYRNFKIIDKAADSTQEVLQTGLLKPQTLRSAVRQVGKESTSRGKSELAQLSRAGMKFANLTNTSGTAENALTQNLLLNPLSLGAIGGGGVGYASGGDPLTGALFGIGGVATPMLMQKALYAPAMREYISKGIVPPMLDPAGRAARSALTNVGRALPGGLLGTE